MIIEKPEDFEQRKRDHINWALEDQNEALGGSGLDEIQLNHNAIPEIDFSDVNIQTQLFGEASLCPLFVSSMTAGHRDSEGLNLVLARACEERNWLMGVGSQRRELYDPSIGREWTQIRKLAPKVQLMGNLGLTQLIQTPLSKIQKMAEQLEAVAMIIHTNPLQEVLQVEGTPYFRGGLAALEKLCKTIEIPVVFKETGCGFSHDNLRQLNNIGLYAVDISGFGGTHWGRVEGCRAPKGSNFHSAAKTFENWGTSTLKSLLMAVEIKPSYEIWASGGVRTGLDAAKLLSLGARAVGLAKPMMVAAKKGCEALLSQMERLEFELKVAMFCTGSSSIKNFREIEKWQIRGK